MKFRNSIARIALAGAIAGGGIAATVAALSGSATAGAASNLITSDTLTLAAPTGSPAVPAAAQSFTIDGASLGINNPVPVGGGTGKAAFTPLVVTLHPGLEEPALLQILGTGEPLNATLDVLVGSAPSGSQPSYFQYKFTKAVLTGDSLVQGGSSGPANGEVTLTFSYVTEAETANIVNASGAITSTTSCWSAPNNGPC